MHLTDDTDIVDEAIDYFRANVLFRSFEIKGGADRVLVYLTLFIQQVSSQGLGELILCTPMLFCFQCVATAAESKSKDDGISKLDALASSAFSLPGDAGFVLGSMLSTPATSAERDQIKLYFKQLRTAVVKRLPAYLYTDTGEPNKWWMAFAKRKFMNKELK